MGIRYDEFWYLNPRKINVIIQGYKLSRQVKDEQMWYLGSYVFDAVTIALGNAFRKKGQKAQEYFEVVKEPLLVQMERQKKESKLSEKEKRTKTEQLFNNLEIMMTNFNLSKKAKK